MGNTQSIKTLYYSQLDGISVEKFRIDIETQKPDRVVFLCETEWHYRELTPEFAEIFNRNNVELIVTYCTFPSEYYDKPKSYFNRMQIVNWGTYWFNWSMICSIGNRLDFNVKYDSFKYPYISMMNRNHYHRCLMIDELARNNLLDSGIVTWHKFPNKSGSSNEIYPMKYYDDSIRTLGDEFVTKLDSFLMPDQYHESFLDVIVESTIDVTCISEKTCLPILYKKPFVLLSNPGYHKQLVDLGFQLYDEIIDYSFDSEPDVHKRAYTVSEIVKDICKRDVNELYKLIKPKADYNYENYMKVMRDPKYVPDIIKERAYMVRNDPNIVRNNTDHRYLQILEQVGL